MFLQFAVERRQGGSQAEKKSRTGMWMIYIAVAIDLSSDGLVTGAGSAVSLNLALVLAAGQVLANVPEGYASVANFRPMRYRDPSGCCSPRRSFCSALVRRWRPTSCFEIQPKG